MPMVADVRMFGGKRFTKSIGIFTKQQAITKQKRMKRAGYLTRLIKAKGGYFVYHRGVGYV